LNLGRKKAAIRNAEAAQHRGAVRSESRWRHELRAWAKRHRQEASKALQRMLVSPVSSMVTWLVIGIAMALPASLYLALNNVEQLGAGWDGAARISLYLNLDVSHDEGERLGRQLEADSRLDSAIYISAAEALEEFRAMSGYGEVLDSLPDNPLPAVIVVRPSPAVDVPATEALVNELQLLPVVEQAQLDMEWVQRLYAITDLGKRAVWVLAIMLALGVLLITGNTIRLAIEGRRDEIVVVKLVGGSDAFVRRPFLYTGFWYGLGGALVGWIILHLALWWLKGPIAELAGLYESSFALLALGFVESLALLALGSLLGLAGAWLAVSRHLGLIEPR
jgi:cell division transport system permease protein